MFKYLHTIVKVLLPVVKLFPLAYEAHDNLNLELGDLVVVPFRNKNITGIVWQTEILSSPLKLKAVSAKLPPEFRLSKDLLSLITKVSDYYLCDLGTMAKLVLPVEIAGVSLKVVKQLVPQNLILPPLSASQQQALQAAQGCHKPSVIKGVTGSGKTEVYFHLLSKYLKQNQQVLIMLPEIALSQQIIKRFTARFGFAPVIWNSGVTKAKKTMILRGILSGEVKLVIGARSSLFLPYRDLGLIIVDEEHDASYKQQDRMLYNARDMAVLRGSISNTKVVLCSATPSLETLYNCLQSKYQLIKLPDRYHNALIPTIQIIDMKQEKLAANSWLSTKLITAINETLNRGEQVLLFLNRRGYSPLVLCKSCGHRFSCSACSAWLVFHKLPKKLECHHCGLQSKMDGSCPQCQGVDSLIFCGPGIERIREEILGIFPSSNIALFSKDQVLTVQQGQSLLAKMADRQIDILIGTQIITKGYHFPNLTLVGVIDADFGLLQEDLRSVERTYQLLNQVGGRAGREDKPGHVFLQTYYPQNIVLNTLKNNSEEEFIKLELQNRENFCMPPFTKMASIILIDKNEARACAVAKQLVAIAPPSSVKILGPARGIMAKVAGKYRYRILAITDKKFNLQKYIATWLSLIKPPSSVQIRVDIDPQSFY